METFNPPLFFGFLLEVNVSTIIYGGILENTTSTFETISFVFSSELITQYSLLLTDSLVEMDTSTI